MTQKKFTPGPWRMEIVGGKPCVIAADDELVCEGFKTPFRTEEEAMANAFKASAAPELYEVCEAQHKAIDILLAMLIEAVPGFYPSKSGFPWEAMLKGNVVRTKARGELSC